MHAESRRRRCTCIYLPAAAPTRLPTGTYPAPDLSTKGSGNVTEPHTRSGLLSASTRPSKYTRPNRSAAQNESDYFHPVTAR
jgi:hypothetical protein